METSKLMEIFPFIFSDGDDGALEKVSPSNFLKEITRSTAERTELLLHHGAFVKNIIKKKFPYAFKPSIPVVIFQSYTPENVYVVSLSVLNTDKVTRYLTMTFQKSPYFSICYSSQAMIKVAPGISEKFLIKFIPLEKRDYYHKITFNCEDGSFDIPIYAIGPRPLLDIPDVIQLHECPVNMPTTNVFCIFNKGEVDAVFNLVVPSPFHIQPKNACLKPGENIQISVTFNSKMAGNFQEFIKVIFDNGEELHCSVSATAKNSQVNISDKILEFEDTFMGLSRQKIVSIHNNSSHVVNFTWMQFSSVEEDEEVARNKEDIHEISGAGDGGSTQEVTCDSNRNLGAITDFSSGDPVNCVRDDESLFHGQYFSFLQLKGDIWPGSSVDVQVLFTPEIGPKKYECVAYCETSGCGSRHKLVLRGSGLGPKIEVFLQHLNIGGVYATVKNSYEVVVGNKGDIVGQIEFISSPLDFAGLLECTPQKLVLEPGQHSAFVLSYIGEHKGQIIEEVIFRIHESGEIRKLFLSGDIQFAELKLPKASIDLGALPVGFPALTSVKMENTALIPISFVAFVAGDNTAHHSSSSYWRHSYSSRNSPPVQEVFVDPHEGYVEPNESIYLNIKVLPEAAGNHTAQVIVDMWEGKTCPLIITLQYRKLVPEVSLDPEEINLKLCFLKQIYKQHIDLTNTSNCPAKYCVLDDEVAKNENLSVTTDFNEGVLAEHSSVKIPINIEVSGVGKFMHDLKVKVFGMVEILTCKLICEGKGPLIIAEVKNLSWGDVPLFISDSKSFKIQNYSPAVAVFSCEMQNRSSPWKIQPTEGSINPLGIAVISLELFLIDKGIFEDLLIISIGEIYSLTVNVSATGCGTSIVADPPISPVLDLEKIFCFSSFSKGIRFTNYGSYKTTIIFNHGNKKSKKSKSENCSVVFDFSPQKLVLDPGESDYMYLQATHDRAEEVSESFWFWNYAEGQKKREQIFDGVITAVFIPLLVTFSSEKLELLSHKNSIVRDLLVVTNETCLFTTSTVTTEHPFTVVHGQRSHIVMKFDLPPHEPVDILIEFDPTFMEDNRSRTFHRTLIVAVENMPDEFHVKLTGHVAFPHIFVHCGNLDFGCIVAGSTEKRTVKILNDSLFPAEFFWKWINGSVILPHEKLYTANSVVSRVAEDGSNEFSASMVDALVRDLKQGKEDYLRRLNFQVIPRCFDSVEEEDNEKNISLFLSENEMPFPLSWVFDVMPKYGILNPHQSLDATLLFRGHVPLRASALLSLDVSCGASETIVLSAKSTNVQYSLDKTFINFKKNVFCLAVFDKIKLTNRGDCSFYFSIEYNEKYLNGSKSESYETPDLFSMEPESGYVDGHSTMEIQISCVPRKLGQFMVECKLCIPNIEPIHINVTGFGFLPQVYFNLPKDLSSCYKEEWSPIPEYIGISSIVKGTVHDIDYTMFVTPDLENINEKDWVWISFEDEFPTKADIYMAVEWEIAKQYVKENPWCALEHISMKKPTSVPGLIVPPYIIDMDIVIINEETTYSVILENFGPIDAHVYVRKTIREKMNREGFKIDISKKKIRFGEAAIMYITLYPSRQIYPENHYDVESTLHIDVVYGISIPINIYAEVTIPFATLEEIDYDFNQVNCGYCRTHSVLLQNVGWVECEWKLQVAPVHRTRLKTINKCKTKNTNKRESWMNPFYASPEVGELKPGEVTALQISFEPHCGGQFEAELIINVMGNPDVVKCTLKGTGLDPVLKFNVVDINFPPIIPKAEKSDASILITNPNKYPVEVFLPLFDGQIFEEERIFQLLLHYYNTDNLMIPASTMGEPYTKIYRDFYLWICELLIKEIQKQSQSITSLDSFERPNKISRRKSSASKSKKSVSSSHLEERSSLEPFDLSQEKNQFFLEAALEKYFFGEIKIPAIENRTQDPLSKSMENLVEKENQNKGSIVWKDSPTSELNFTTSASVYIFHGAPYSDSVQIAYRASRKLGLPVLKIDDLIIEEAVYGASASGNEIKNLIMKVIDDLFSKVPETTVDEVSSSDVQVSPSMDSNGDPIEELSNKLATYLVEMRKVVTVEDKDQKSSPSEKTKQSKSSKASSKKSSAKSSKASSAKSSKKKDKTIDPVIEDLNVKESFVPLEITPWTDLPYGLHLSNIPEFLLEDILSTRMQQPEFLNGFVVPTLWSVFFQSVDRVLMTLLKVAGKNYSIYCSFIHNTFDDHINVLKERKRYQESKKAYKEDILNIMDQTENYLLQPQTFADASILEKNFASSNESDEYLKMIKMKINQLKKFSRVMEFVEMEKILIKRGKKTSKVTIRKIQSKSGKNSSLNMTDVKKSGKKVEESKSKIGKSMSARKLRNKKGTSEEKEGEIGVKTPFPLEVCDDIGLDVGQTINLWNEFDDFDNVLRCLLSLLENWSETLEKKLMPSDKEKQWYSSMDTKTRMSKSFKRADIQSTLHHSKKKSTDSRKMPEDADGIPVVIVNSSDIGSDTVKSFLYNLICPKGIPYFEHQIGLQKKKSNLMISKPHDLTYLHIRKEWFKRTKEMLENSFTLSSLDLSEFFPSILKTKSINITVERIEPPDIPLSNNAQESLEVTPENQSKRKSDTGKEDSQNPLALNHFESSEKVKPEKFNLLSSIKARHILEPGETIGYNISYSPIEKGVHQNSLSIELCGWQKSYTVNISGISDSPQIDTNPEVIFPKCVQEKSKYSHAIYSPTYFYDIEALDFGLLPVEKKVDVNAISKLNFKNISQVPLTAMFMLQSKQGNFILDQEELEIKPNDIGNIHITANPKYTHQVQETLICAVSDNPELVHLKLTYTGYKVKVHLQPKQLTFEPVLIFRKQWLTLFLKNLCATSLYWHIASSDFVKCGEFLATPAEGILELFSTTEIEVEFCPSKVQITTIPLCIELFVTKEDTEPILSETVIVSGEAYDVAVDVNFAYCDENNSSLIEVSNDNEGEKEPNHLDFGLMKAETERCMLIALGNRGKCSVEFAILEDEPMMQSLGIDMSQILQIQPLFGTLEAGSRNVTMVFIKCFSTVEINMQHLPILKCRLIDRNVPQVENQVVADIPVHVTLKAVYSKYNLKPSTGLKFGVVKTGTQKTLAVVIHNKGEYEFIFNITRSKRDSSEGSNEEDEILNIKKTSAEVPNASPKVKTKGQTELMIDCFKIIPASGSLHPDESRDVLVHCEPKCEGTFREAITITVSDTHPSELPSKMFLSATSYSPAVDFSNIEKIFIEHLVCEDFSVFKCPSKAISYAVYSKKDNELGFKGVYVNHTVEARLCLHNCSLIPADVEISIQPVGSESTNRCPYLNKERTDNEQAVNCFLVVPEFVEIPPCSDEWITVSFSPCGTEISCAHLEVIVESDLEAAWSCLLSGEGLLPELSLTSPPDLQKNAEGKYPFILPERLVGSFERFIFSFKNSGRLTCKVIMEFNGDENSFQIFPDHEADNFLKEFQPNVPLKKLTTFELGPGEEVSFWFCFFGYSPGTFLEDLFIGPVGNPFGSIIIEVNVNCIDEAVHIEGLEYVKKHFYEFDDATYNKSLLSFPVDKYNNSSSDITSDINDEKRKLNPNTSLEGLSLKSSMQLTDNELNLQETRKNIFSRHLLDFKNCYVGQAKTIRFWLINHTKHNYTFQWFGLESVPQLQLCPQKGFISPISSVTITATCCSKTPLFIDQALLRCFLFKIDVVVESNCFRKDKFVKIKTKEQELKVEEEETIFNLIEQNEIAFTSKSCQVEIEQSGCIDGSQSSEGEIELKGINDVPKSSDLYKLSECEINWNGNKNMPKLSEVEDNSENHSGWNEGNTDSFIKFQNESENPELGFIDAENEKAESEYNDETGNYKYSKESNYINVILSAVVDYPMCSSNAPSQITFGNVPISETRSHSVTLTNVGRVSLKYVWKFKTLVYFSSSKSLTHKFNFCGITRLKKRKGRVTFISVRGRTSKQYYMYRRECIFKPFQVTPSEGLLKQTGDMNVCNITFTPQTSGYYQALLYCRVNKPCKRPIVSKILLEGVGKQKLYYFEFVESNDEYSLREVISSKKQSTKVCSAHGVPDPEMETVKLHVIGFGTKISKILQFHNLSCKTSTFNWKIVDEQNMDTLGWKCKTPSGIIYPKSVTQMEFDFAPWKLGVLNSQWYFTLFQNQKKCLLKKFHFIGVSSEPAVYFTESCIQIKQAVPGMTYFKDACLVNEEEVAIRFRVYSNYNALKDENGVLKIKPENGVMKPKTSTKIRLYYTPENTENRFLHLKFKIQKKPNPLVLTVFCEGYCVQAEVKFILPTFSMVKHLTEDRPNDIKFGRIQEKTTIYGTFELFNRGLYAFNYSWSYKVWLAKEIGLDLKITNIEGKVLPASKIVCCLSIILDHKSRIDNYPLVLKIFQGPTYHIYLSMIATAPLCQFSFFSHDFGLCLVGNLQPFSRNREVVLTVTGYDKNPIMLECNLNPVRYLTVDFKKGIILFNETLKIPIIFTPQDYVRYRAKIPFTINGSWKRSIVVTGQGIPLKMELLNPRDVTFDFKSLQVGERVSKIIPIINKTLIPIDVHFGFSNERGCRDNWKSISILPNNKINMAKGEVIKIKVTFSPIARMARFTEKVVAFVEDYCEEYPLSVFHASSEEVDIVLNSPCIQFGRVPKGITVVSYVSLINDGEIGKKYLWDRQGKLNKQFSIAPTSGFLNPGEIANFRITFKPMNENSYVKCKICCVLKQYKKIYLDVSGFGTELPFATESITFSSLLREHDRNFVTIENRSDKAMELIPYLIGDNFSGPNLLLIGPCSESTYEISYLPKSIKGSYEHSGKLYFHLPTGENYGWNLIGTVKPPLPCSTVKREVQSKVSHMEILRVENCLPVPQRFHVHTELVLGKDGEPTFSITGYSGVRMENSAASLKFSDSKKGKFKFSPKTNEEGQLSAVNENHGIGGCGEPGGYIDVPANTEVSYKVNFICFKECELHFKVFFQCEETMEYKYHELYYTVIEKKPDIIEIKTSVFKRSCRILNVLNPLSSTLLKFSFSCDLDFITLPDPITVLPKCKESVIFYCFPLLAGHFEGSLTVVCPELGDDTYALDVSVSPIPKDEYQSFQFTAALGSSGGPEKPIYLNNYSKTDAYFSCMVNSDEFIVDKRLFVGAETEEILDVVYEPSELGFSKAILTAESETAGSFCFKLVGNCTPPKIKGPCKVLANSQGVNIVFKNVFRKGMNFSFAATEPFITSISHAWMEPKEEKTITVSLDLPNDESTSLPATGSLIIMPLNSEISSNTKWEYYLKGVIL